MTLLFSSRNTAEQTSLNLRVTSRSGDRFSKVPKLFGRILGDIIKTKASRGTTLCSYFHFYSLYNVWKDQNYGISWSEFLDPKRFRDFREMGSNLSASHLGIAPLSSLTGRLALLQKSVQMFWSSILQPTSCTLIVNDSLNSLLQWSLYFYSGWFFRIRGITGHHKFNHDSCC